uniref:F-box domain-containing protein n=1 Tax=Caenorhabditis japonica TaxID=281687 RepID=A0A8R1HLI9_CAEJA
MPFIGRDWRAPGETWVRTPHTNGWERTKLRPVQISSEPILIPQVASSPTLLSASSPKLAAEGPSLPARFGLYDSEQNSSCGSLPGSTGDRFNSSSEDSDSNDATWIPHCFVKSTSKEFIGCTSMSEAFHRLDLARAVNDVRRFNFICKVVQILVEEKLPNLSATARKSLLGILSAICFRSSNEDVHVSTAKDLVTQFGNGLDGVHICGSPQLISRHHQTASSLLDLISEKNVRTAADADDETALTFLDLPREVVLLILKRLSDHNSLLEASQVHEALKDVIDGEDRLWQSLCHFHFQDYQIKNQKTAGKSWRQAFFDLKKYHGCRELYADLIHICCHCKALFWKSLGHPCVRETSAPSVRVTPRQFVDMLIYL